MLKAHRPVGLLQAYHVVAALTTLREQVVPEHLSAIVLQVKELLDDDGSFRWTEETTESSTGASGLVYELLAYAMDLKGLNRAAVAAAEEVCWSTASLALREAIAVRTQAATSSSRAVPSASGWRARSSSPTSRRGRRAPIR
jgi:hypothetical protein